MERLGQQRERAEVLVVAVAIAREGGVQRVVPFVGPRAVDSVAAGVAMVHDARVVPVALGHEEQGTARRRGERVDFDRERFEHVHRGVVDDRVHCVESQSVGVVVAQPHRRVVDHEATDLVAVGPVEVHGCAPVRVVATREIGAELGEVVTRRSEVVVHHVDHDAESVVVARVDETLEAVGTAVRVVRCEQVDSVVTPSAVAGEFDDGEQLDRVDAERHQVIEALDHRVERAARSERAHVQLVQHRTAQRHAAPRVVAPRERVVVDHLRQRVDSLRLVRGPGIGARGAAVDGEAVALARLRAPAGQVPPPRRARAGRRHGERVATDHEVDARRVRRPHRELAHRHGRSVPVAVTL